MGPELSDYLSGLISSRDFIQAVNGYRDLTVLSNNLSQWLKTIPALNLVLDEKINTYNHHLSTAINSLKFESAKKLQDRRTEFVEQLEKALTSNSTTILLNKEEKEIIGRLNKLESGLKKLNANDAEVMAMKDKHHFLSGILQWNISTDYAPRLWAVKTSIAELDRALQRVNHTIQLLTTVWEAAPATHQRFRDQLKGKKERIKTLMSNIEQVMSVQEQNIQLMAEAAINQYRDDLKPYHDRALFARARLYDSMVRKN
jgi:chromosome segregation ATPase